MTYRNTERHPFGLDTACRQRGLGLVEIMVGLVIGMIGVVVIFSVLAIAEERKRSTGAGSDAQTAGAIALFTLERDIRQAGYGLSGTATEFYSCPVAIHHNGSNFTLPLAPVRIDHGTSDTITVWYGNSDFGAITKQFGVPSTAETKTITDGVGGLQQGDLLLIAGSVPGASGCADGSNNAVALVELTDNTDPTGQLIKHESGVPFNREGGPNIPGSFSTGYVFNLGKQPVVNQWSVSDAETLRVQDQLRGAVDAIDVGESIINLQAQYGINTAPAGAQPVISWQDAEPTATQWPNVRAIRVAILTRSANWERSVVTPEAPAWYDDTSGNSVPFTMSQLADGTDWQNYRYRVYQTVIPLSNVVMGEGT